MRVKILKNPVGLYNLAYDPGDVIELPDLLANELIETGHAEKIPEVIQNAKSKVKAEKR